MGGLNFKKNILSELALYYGNISMPKGFEIDNEVLRNDTLKSIINKIPFPFSKELDKLHSFFREHFFANYSIQLQSKNIYGSMYEPKESSEPLKNVDPLSYRESPDFIMLYGVNVDNCMVRIYYDDNRRKNRSWDIKLENNKFIMFPSTQTYYITNNQKDSLNFILSTEYEFI